jgi:hypothetical protein
MAENFKATTVRELYKLLEGDNPEYLDVPVFFDVRSATSSSKSERIPMTNDLWALPRFAPNPQTKENGCVFVQINLRHHSMSRRNGSD